MIGFKTVFFVTLITLSLAKVYDRCKLAKQLLNVYHLPKNQISTWVCIAYQESRFDTAAKSSDGHDYGIFQISNLYWCSPPGTGCNTPCSKFLDDNIADDVKCARTVYDVTQKERGNGFEAWTTYSRCKNNVDQYTAGCF